MSAGDTVDTVVTLTTFADAKDAYRSRDLRQALYDAGEVVMADVLVNPHGTEHRDRRRVENRMFRREVFERYERELFPRVTRETLAPYQRSGGVGRGAHQRHRDRACDRPPAGPVAAHPQRAADAADPLFVQRAVHETVRLNPSSPTGVRRALAPVTLRSGVEIPAGATVVIDLMAVNRDRELFGPAADRFDPDRVPPPGVAPFGLGFAAGMHVCIGQDLAAGVVAGPGTDPHRHLFGLVAGAVMQMFAAGVRRDPDRPPERDAATARPYWGNCPVLLGEGAR